MRTSHERELLLALLQGLCNFLPILLRDVPRSRLLHLIELHKSVIQPSPDLLWDRPPPQATELVSLRLDGLEPLQLDICREGNLSDGREGVANPVLEALESFRTELGRRVDWRSEVFSREGVLLGLVVEIGHMMEAFHCEDTHSEWINDFTLPIDQILELVYPFGCEDVARHEL